jgi:hypothetical protein
LIQAKVVGGDGLSTSPSSHIRRREAPASTWRLIGDGLLPNPQQCFGDTDFAGLPPIEVPEGRKLETLGLPGLRLGAACSRAECNPVAARTDALLKAAEHGGPFS